MRKVYSYLICLAALLPSGRAQLIYQYTGPIATPSSTDWFDRQQEQNWLLAHRQADRPTGENVSVTRLGHRPPAKAQKAFDRGLKLAVAEEWQKAVEQFQAAVAIDPKFSEAHGNMGVEYTAMRKFEEAATEFRRAVQIDPATGVFHTNLAYALFRLDQEAEALPEAQTGVSLDPTNSKCQFLLGYLQARRPEMAERGKEHLLYAAREVPEAHVVLSELYRLEGAQQSADEELERYRKATSNQKP
jgi:Tfp pilus assembly protein PilF